MIFFSKYRKDHVKFAGRRVKSEFIKFALDNFIDFKEVTSAAGNTYEELNGSIDLTQDTFNIALRDFKIVFL